MQALSATLYQPSNWTVDRVLQRQALRRPDKICVKTTAGESVTYSQAYHAANRVAHFLKSLTVEKGDRVAVMLPNGLPYCFAWFGISFVGAVHVAVNLEYKGAFLKHVLNNSGARILITDADRAAAVAEIESDLNSLQTVVAVGKVRSELFQKIGLQPLDKYKEYSSEPVVAVADYRDLACIMYTSGTTGPAKGVLMPHAHLYLFGLGTIENMRLSENDTFYVVLPLFHANGMFMQLYACLIMGSTAVIRERFSASEWIHDIVRFGATITNSLGVVCAFVLNQPPSDADTKHNLHTIGVAPNPPDLDARLRARFGIKNVIGLYGMTEVNIPLYTEPGIPRPGSCGKLWDRYFELQIVDPETDQRVARGTVGEIVVRPKQPFGFMAGYNAMPEQTVDACRNFWFHTGDAAIMDEEGYVYFTDRLKDCIRRRGENISSFDIEKAVCDHEDVAEVAAVAVKSEISGGEDEVKIVVVCKPDRRLSPEALIRFCEQKLPRFAVPRYIEFVAALPKTPTAKVRKNLLREAGVGAQTWDRLAGEKR